MPLSQMKEWDQDQRIACTQCVHTQTQHIHAREGKRTSHLDPDNSCGAMSREY